MPPTNVAVESDSRPHSSTGIEEFVSVDLHDQQSLSASVRFSVQILGFLEWDATLKIGLKKSDVVLSSHTCGERAFARLRSLRHGYGVVRYGTTWFVDRSAIDYKVPDVSGGNQRIMLCARRR